MAKVYYSALVNRMGGRISHGVASNWKGRGVLKRHNAHPHNPRSEAQQTIRGLLNDLSGEYYSLTSIQKELWQSYSVALPDGITPLNAFIRLNMIMQKYFPGSSRLETPPPTPSTPEHLMGLSVSPIGTGNFCIQWTSPSSGTDAAVFDFWPMPGYDNTISPNFKFGVSADVVDLCVAMNSDYPAGTVLRFRGRTVDAFGRVSPWTNIVSATTV